MHTCKNNYELNGKMSRRTSHVGCERGDIWE